ncbi:MAG: YgaP-like transmembrane domain [Haloferacaceae archaeon]
MALERNVGGRDRRLRAGLAVVLLVVAALALRSDRRAVAVVAVVGATGLGFNAVTCFCGLNALLGVDTTEE